MVVHDSLDLAGAARLAGATRADEEKHVRAPSRRRRTRAKRRLGGCAARAIVVGRAWGGRRRSKRWAGRPSRSRFPGSTHSRWSPRSRQPAALRLRQGRRAGVRRGVPVRRRRRRQIREPRGAGGDVFRAGSASGPTRASSRRCERCCAAVRGAVVARPLARVPERSGRGGARAARRMPTTKRAPSETTRLMRRPQRSSSDAAFGFEYDTHDSVPRAGRAAPTRARRGGRRGGAASRTRAAARDAHGADAGGLTRLDLHGVGLTRVENLDGCGNLQSLVLAFNNISKLENLESLTSWSTWT